MNRDDLMKQDTPALALKKATLSAWAKILYKEDMIDLSRYTRMILAIWRFKDETPVSAEPEEAAPDEKTGLQMAG